MLERIWAKLFDLSQSMSASENRLIREARARYDSIFAPADPVSEERDMAQITRTLSGANAHCSEVDLLS
jgi:hypothetical protein